jgi:AcrR family transcriptional regulator
MAKSGTTGTVRGKEGGQASATRRLLVDAAIETLKRKGFAGASARAIAEVAGSNQGLIFYHFGSVTNLLLAALDSVSAERLGHYGQALDRVESVGDLVEAATDIFETDLDAGYITVLVEMIAGASSSPGLGAEVAARIGPWRSFAQHAIERSVGGSPLGQVLPAADVAYAVVALYLGLEMLSHLDGDRGPALTLFAHAQRLASLMGAMTPPVPTGDPS